MHLLFAALLLGHWLLASDLHVEPHAAGPVPSTFGSDTNWALFDSTVAAMRRADPNPSVVVLSGDFLAHNFPRNVALAEQTMWRIARAFDAAFPRAQFIIVPGNNDDPCGDYRVTPGTPYFAFVDRNGAAPQFERTFAQYGWYTARLPLRGVHLVALDSVYWSIVYRACGGEHPDAPQRELRWLANQLRALPKGERAILVMHIPPGVDGHSTLMTHRLLVVPYWREDAASAFTRLLQNAQGRIPFAIAGHEHRNDFRLFGGVPILVAPSVSPVYHNNPAFLELDVAADGTLNDYRMFAYDEFEDGWQNVNAFDSLYGVGAFSAGTLAWIHDRLRTDTTLRAMWARFFMSGSGYREITSGTWRTYWCAQTTLASAFIPCAGLQDRVQVLPIAAGIVAGAAVLLAVLGVRLARARRRA
jgi:predicted phosphodiesterase